MQAEGSGLFGREDEGHLRFVLAVLAAHRHVCTAARARHDARKTSERELESLRRRQDRIAELEHDGIMEQYAELIPAELESLAPEERHRVYRLLRLQVVT